MTIPKNESVLSSLKKNTGIKMFTELKTNTETALPGEKESSDNSFPGIRSVDNETVEYLNVLLYGRPGSGKTTFAGTFPKKILIVDIQEHGIQSLKGQDIDYLPLESVDQIDPNNPTSLFWWLKNHPNKYNTVVFDTITQLQDMILAKVMKNTVGREVDSAPYLSDWLPVANKFKSIILQYKELPLHKVYIAQGDRESQPTGDVATGQIIPSVGPYLSPGVAKAVIPAMDIVGHIYIDNKVVTEGNKLRSIITHMIRLGENKVYLAKVRKPKEYVAPESIANPNFQDLLEVIKGTYKEVS